MSRIPKMKTVWRFCDLYYVFENVDEIDPGSVERRPFSESLV